MTLQTATHTATHTARINGVTCDATTQKVETFEMFGWAEIADAPYAPVNLHTEHGSAVVAGTARNPQGGSSSHLKRPPRSRESTPTT